LERKIKGKNNNEEKKKKNKKKRETDSLICERKGKILFSVFFILSGFFFFV
jgi:hypothetical protein